MGTKIHCLRSDGQFNTEKAVTDPDFPGSIFISRKKQQYALVGNPIFPDTLTLFIEEKDGRKMLRPFLTWEEFTAFKPPPIRRENDKSIMVVKEDDFLPISNTHISLDEETEIRNNTLEYMLQEGLNRGRGMADQMSQGMYSLIVITLAAIAGFATIITGVLFLIGKLGR